MSNVGSIALSGLSAASLRLQVSAGNVANAQLIKADRKMTASLLDITA
jgi:flagellar basal body rod protein FlgC